MRTPRGSTTTAPTVSPVGCRATPFDDKMREKGRADYKDAYLNVPGAFAWIILCAAPGCRNKSEHFDHHALSRQFTGPLCNEHNTSGKRARDQFGPEHSVKMAENAEAHLRVGATRSPSRTARATTRSPSVRTGATTN